MIKTSHLYEAEKHLNFNSPLCYAQGAVVVLRSGKEP